VPESLTLACDVICDLLDDSRDFRFAQSEYRQGVTPVVQSLSYLPPCLNSYQVLSGASCKMSSMISGNSFRWTDPSTWPWIVYVWFAMFLAGSMKPSWRWIQRQRANSWPAASGQIEYASVSEAKQSFFSTSRRGNSPSHVGELGYSYFVAGNSYGGRNRWEFWSEEEALEFVRDLKGKPVAVQCNPSKPSTSILLESSVETLLNTRPLKPQSEVELFKSALADESLTWPKTILLEASAARLSRMDALHGLRLLRIRLRELRSLYGTSSEWARRRHSANCMAGLLWPLDAVLFRRTGDSVLSSEGKRECPALP
jgi:hypothetical protein